MASSNLNDSIKGNHTFDGVRNVVRLLGAGSERIEALVDAVDGELAGSGGNSYRTSRRADTTSNRPWRSNASPRGDGTAAKPPTITSSKTCSAQERNESSGLGESKFSDSA